MTSLFKAIAKLFTPTTALPPLAKIDLNADPRQLDPAQYLEWRKALWTERHLTRMRTYEDAAGVHTTMEDGVPRTDIVDLAAYKGHLSRQGMTAEQIEKQIDFETRMEPNISRQQLLEHARTFDERIQNVRKFCIDALLPEQHARLEAVPVGTCHVGYYNGGAFPVPRGGDAILIFSGLNYFWWWSAWIRFLMQQAAVPEVSHPLLRALPDLAGFIISGRPFPEFMLFLREAQQHPDLFENEETVRRAWFADCFVLLHEYGHVLLGHTDKIRSTKVSVADRYRFEFEADRFAVEILRDRTSETDTMSNSDNALAAMHELFLIFLFDEMSAHTTRNRDTHPPARDRLKNMLQAYMEPFPKDGREAESLLQAADLLFGLSMHVRTPVP